jgi:hypothetical protein
MPTAEQREKDRIASERAQRLCGEWQREEMKRRGASRGGIPIDEMSAFMAGVMAAERWFDDYKLPCDVTLPPRTIIRQGCSMETLLTGLIAREKLGR